MPLGNVVGVVNLKEGDKVEFLACAAATLSNKQLGDNVMSSGFSRPATEVVKSSISQRIGAEASAAAVTLNDRCLSGSKGISSTLTIPLPNHRNQKTYMGLVLVKDLEDTGVQKREGSRKSRHAATAIRMILAKGPDGTKGFLPGWCSRYPAVAVAAVVQGEEGSKQDDDVRNDIVVPVGVSSEESVVVSTNNTKDCSCSSSNSREKGDDTTAISTTTAVSMST